MEALLFRESQSGAVVSLAPGRVVLFCQIARSNRLAASEMGRVGGEFFYNSGGRQGAYKSCP